MTDAPSILNQGFECQFFNFGRAQEKGIDYFNCGLIQRRDGLWLLVRRSKWQKHLKYGFNDIVAFKLNGTQPTIGIPVRIQKRFEGEQYEDPRGFTYGDWSFVSCCNFIWHGRNWTGAHQLIAQVGDDWRSVNRVHPVYGDNGDNLGKNTGHEKNWLWFAHEESPYLLYSAQKHKVARFNWKFEMQEEWHTPGVSNIFWRYGHIRGGTPPVRVEDEYITFFHSSMPWTETKRRYYMGAYAFSAEPPFAPTRATLRPLLVGSQEDPWAEGKPLVVFPCGCQLQGDTWFVTLGVNDLCSAWVKIPHRVLEKRLMLLRNTPLPEQRVKMLVPA